MSFDPFHYAVIVHIERLHGEAHIRLAVHLRYHGPHHAGLDELTAEQLFLSYLHAGQRVGHVEAEHQPVFLNLFF